jgi:DNA-binding LacI/PurR family transcriptional regulator
VVMDMAGGMRQAIEHLHALGHRRCAYVSGPRPSWSNQQRRKALRATADRLGVEVSVLGPFEPSYEAGQQAADLALAERPTAIVVFNDLMAMGVLARLADRGVAVPGEVSVVGFDDIQMAALASPPLTTVSVPTAAAGRAAVDLLLGAIDGDRDGRRAHALNTELLVRGSTGPPPGTGRAATGSGGRRAPAKRRTKEE